MEIKDVHNIIMSYLLVFNYTIRDNPIYLVYYCVKISDDNYFLIGIKMDLMCVDFSIDDNYSKITITDNFRNDFTNEIKNKFPMVHSMKRLRKAKAMLENA